MSDVRPTSEELFEERCLAHGICFCLKCLNENRAKELLDLRAELTATESLVTALQEQMSRLAEQHAEALSFLKDPQAVRVNIMRGTIAIPADLVWLGDTDGPVARRVAEAREEQREACALVVDTRNVANWAPDELANGCGRRFGTSPSRTIERPACV